MQHNDFFADLRIAFVEGHGTDLRVDLYGGDDAVCGSLVFTFDSPAERREQQATVTRWRDAGTTVHLSYVGEDAILTRSLLLDLR